MTKRLPRVPEYELNDEGKLEETELTVKDFAKKMVMQYGNDAVLWRDNEPENLGLMNKALQYRIDVEILKQIKRVEKFLFNL